MQDTAQPGAVLIRLAATQSPAVGARQPAGEQPAPRRRGTLRGAGESRRRRSCSSGSANFRQGSAAAAAGAEAAAAEPRSAAALRALPMPLGRRAARL